MTHLSTFTIILTSAFSQPLAQSIMSQQQPLVQISDFTFSMNQEPITINYLVDIQEFTADQIEQLKSSVTTIAKANDYYLAVENTDGASRDLILKTLFLNLVSFNQHFTETLEILNAYLNSKRDSKHDFAAKDYACVMSQKLYHKNITEILFEEIDAYLIISQSLTLNEQELTNVKSDKYNKAKNTLASVLNFITQASKDFDELFDRMYDLLENNLPPPFYTHLKVKSDCNLDGQTVITDVSCHLYEKHIGCIILGLQLKEIQRLPSYFFIPIHGHTLSFKRLLWSNDRMHSIDCHSESKGVYYDCAWEDIEATCVAALQKDGPDLRSVISSCPWTKMASPNNVIELDDQYVVTGLFAKSAREMLTGVDNNPHETQVLSLKLDRAIKLSDVPPVWLRRKSTINKTAELYMTDDEFELLQSTLNYDVLQDVVEHIAFYPAVSATAVVIVATGIIVLLVTYFRTKLTKTKLSTKYLPFIPWNRGPAAARPRSAKNLL